MLSTARPRLSLDKRSADLSDSSMILHNSNELLAQVEKREIEEILHEQDEVYKSVFYFFVLKIQSLQKIIKFEVMITSNFKILL